MNTGFDPSRERPLRSSRRGPRPSKAESRIPRARYPGASAPPHVHELSTAEQHPPATEAPALSPFSRLLQQLLKRDRAEITRVAHVLNVSENTVYRWMNGISEPRPIYLKQLLDALPDHRRELTAAIQESFPNALETSSVSELPEVARDLYRQVLDLRATIAEDDTRRWQIIQAIFEQAIKHLDLEQHGIALTYAELMPPHEDGIHSLYEAEMRATSPWPSNQESRAFLGSTTLAGTAAILQHPQIWSDLNGEQRHQFFAEEFERSACACPVMYAGRCSGVLIVSSTRPDFFTQPVRQAVAEYAHLLSLALKEAAFYAPGLLHLRPMPDIRWQRSQMSRSFIQRVISCARKYQLSRQEAEMRVRLEMEAEFEEIAPTQLTP
jgi:transcriptional regulator with XRE-family HTH domain